MALRRFWRTIAAAAQEVEYTARMHLSRNRRASHQASLLAALLAVVGSFAFAAGVYVAVMTIIHAPAHPRGGDLPLRGAVYVGGSTCFTCHAGQDFDRSLILDVQPAATPMANPQVMALDVPMRQATHPANTGGVTAEALNHPYIIATERDPAFLSGAGQTTPLDSVELDVTCADCHAALAVNLRLKLA
jgi:hypothetical protein